jgi:hypothetical protein
VVHSVSYHPLNSSRKRLNGFAVYSGTAGRTSASCPGHNRVEILAQKLVS